MNHTKLVILSAHREAVYQCALSFVDTAEPTPNGGLATCYHNQAGESLTSLEEVVRAILDNELKGQSNDARID